MEMKEILIVNRGSMERGQEVVGKLIITQELYEKFANGVELGYGIDLSCAVDKSDNKILFVYFGFTFIGGQ
jgi:hypothetical protein